MTPYNIFFLWWLFDYSVCLDAFLEKRVSCNIICLMNCTYSSLICFQYSLDCDKDNGYKKTRNQVRSKASNIGYI
jgi:hypothetical protein